MTRLDTDHLVDCARLGDCSAQTELLVRHRQRLKLMVASLLDPRLAARIDASDIVQDAMAIAARRMPEYLAETQVGFYPWLRGIAKDLLIDVHRKHVTATRRSVTKEQRWGVQFSDYSAMRLAEHLASREPSPSRNFSLQENAQRIRMAMDHMGSTDRELLTMRFVEHLSIREVAEFLSITENTARARARRAIEKLGKALVDNQGPDQ